MKPRPGFTVLELIVALTLSTMVLVAAHQALAVLVENDAALTEASAQNDGGRNGRRLLRALLRDAQADPRRELQFSGDRNSIVLATRCWTAAGWQEWCAVRLSLEPTQVGGARSSRVILTRDDGSRQELTTVPGDAVFTFHDGGRDRYAWLVKWSASSTVPLAVGILAGTDTVIIRVGGAR